MTRFLLCSAVALGGVTFVCCTYNLIAQDAPPPPAAVKLPVTRITLTTAGIGYFHREGTIDGVGRVELRVNEEDVNDLILTLLAEDTKGTGKQITYENRAPAEVTLKSFRVDLAENPGVGMLLGQVRGERVEVVYDTKGDTTGTAMGSIISVQTPQTKVTPPAEGEKAVVIPPRKDEVEQVNLFTEDGLVSVPLAKIRRVKFLKAELQAEFRQALTALASARGDGKKSIGVTFQGQGPRPVSIGYVSEAPLWKPTYRLSMNKPLGQFGNLGGQFGIAGAPPATNAILQSFAAVENTTDEDWKNVKMKLVSSRPITFRMDLYEPLFVPRPTVEPELYASLRPPLYQAPATMFGAGGFAGGMGGNQLGLQNNNIQTTIGNQAQGAGILGANGVANNLGVGGGVVGISGGQLGSSFNSAHRAAVRNRLTYEELRARQSSLQQTEIPSIVPEHLTVTNSANLGESFEYTIAEPVTLARFQSALLPVLNEAVTAERLSIFNPAIHATYALKGVRLRNTSKLFLAQGPVTIYDGDIAVGQARLPDVKPGETQLLSYAIDLDLTLPKQTESHKTTPVSLMIRDGKLLQVTKREVTYTQPAVNRGNDPRRVWITTVRNPEWKLVRPEKPAETTSSLYRFELAVPANATA